MVLGSHVIRHVVEWYLFWHLVDHHHLVLGTLIFLIAIAVVVVGGFLFALRKLR